MNQCSDAGEFAAQRLKPSFAGFSVAEITPLRINEHIIRRQRSGASPATINRETSTLRRMFALAVRMGLLQSVPYIPRLKESAPRQGFVEREQFSLLLAALPDYLKPVVEFLGLSGWRKREALRLTWGEVVLDAKVIRLDPNKSKNREGRMLPLRKRLLDIIQQQWNDRREGCAYVFQHRGQPIRDFRRAWEVATKAAGLEGLLIHDLRRSAVRNLVRAQVPESVAMKISGHRTRSVFERYNITSETDLVRAVKSIC